MMRTRPARPLHVGSLCLLAVLVIGLSPALAHPHRRWNPPGSRGGPGTNWHNPPGPWGGPGASRLARPGYRNNPPGPLGGPGTNWANPPGPRGGPGASLSHRGWPRWRTAVVVN
jgi:hypothetical protein